KLNIENQEFVNDKDLIKAPPGWIPESVKWDAFRKKYWIVSEKGIALFNPVNGKVSYKENNEENDPVISKLTNETYLYGITPLNNGDLIFAKWPPTTGAPSVFHYSRGSNTMKSFYLNNKVGLGYIEINGILQQRGGRVWVFGHPFLVEWNIERDIMKLIPNEYRNEQSLKHDYIHSVFEDKQNNLWLCTDNGLFLFNPDAQVFNTYSLLRENQKEIKEVPIRTVLEVGDHIYVGTWGSGLYIYDKKLNPVPIPSSLLSETKAGISIWDMHVHSKTGKIWMVYQGGKILVYDPIKNTKVEWLPEIFEQRTIRHVEEDQMGNLWFGNQGGRYVKWDYKVSGGDYKKGFKVVFESRFPNKMFVDKQGYLWVATFGEGLLKVNPSTEKIVRRFSDDAPDRFKLSNSVPLDVFQYNDSIIIAITNCINLINTRTNEIEIVDTEDGLPSLVAQTGAVDKNGILWLGMLNGICRVNLQKKTFIMYDRRDGISHDKFTLNGGNYLSDGRMFFATNHDMVVFDPERVAKSVKPVMPVITSFKQGTKTMLVDSLFREQRLVLPHDKNSISIEYGSLQFTGQNTLHYFYKLENLDKDWIHTESGTPAIYNYLPPGEYVFKVKTENADGVTSAELNSFTIVVRPPFWKTWWFYGLVILAVILILYLIDIERVKKQKALQSVRTQIAGNLHREVNATLNNINVLSEIAKIKADKNIEQSKEFIDQISDKSKYMIEAMDDMLWSIDPVNDNMRKTILRIRELTEGLMNAYNCDIDLIIDHKVEKLELDMKQRHDFIFFYKEAISFLLQRIRCHQVFVNISQRKTKLLMEILTECDERANLKAVLSKVVKQRAESLGANVEIMSDKKTLSLVLQVDL
ncbi:MAG TPA: two-component regulator propeller domain-containing protein, partial [Chitinophagaceae bacterium]